MLLSPGTFRRLCRARDVLGDLADEEASIRDVARAAGLSPFHFIRQFEALFGMTPHQFRIRCRVDRAKDLLAQGELSVTEVCMEVGFSSLGTFSDMFSRRVGARPSVYRREIRTLVQVPEKLIARVSHGCLGLLTLLPPAAFS